MGLVYSEFDTTVANLVADLKAKILLSSDYSNPTGQVVKATTPLGAQIVCDLIGGGSPGTAGFTPTFWRLWTGTPGAGTDQLSGRWLYWKRTGTGSTANPLHCRVAAGPTLLYIEIEGPRAAEAGADSTTWGSQRQCVCVAQLTPYFAGDTTPAVVVMGSTSTIGFNQTTSASVVSQLCHVSRDQANASSWVEARPFTLAQPQTLQALPWTTPSLASDGNVYLAPWVIYESVAGMRGRLTDVFYAGWQNAPSHNSADYLSMLQSGDIVTYGGNSHKITMPYKSDGTSSGHVGGSFGMPYNWDGPRQTHGPLLAVRMS